MKWLESEKTLFFVEIGWRNVSFGVMVSVIELRHVSSRNGRSILSEQKVRNPAWNEAQKRPRRLKAAFPTEVCGTPEAVPLSGAFAWRFRSNPDGLFDALGRIPYALLLADKDDLADMVSIVGPDMSNQ